MKHLYRLIFVFTFLFSVSTIVTAQDLISSELVESVTAEEIDVLDDVPSTYDVASYKLVYYTTGLDGEPVFASGLISIPQQTGCDELPMLTYCHGTVLEQFDVPSEMSYSGRFVRHFASSGYIGLGPDYLGLGQGSGLHPYQHAESQATATLDLIEAAREFLEDYNGPSDNGQVFITGYSQGGHASMSALQYANENNLTDEMGIVAGAPLSGSYDMEATVEPIINGGVEYNYLGYSVYLIMSYELAYGNIYNELSDIFQSEYVEAIEQYFDGEQDEYGMGFVHGQLPNQLSELLVDSVLTNLQNNPNHPMWQAVADNNNHDWAPNIPLRMYYCTGDQQVPSYNSVNAEAAMIANGAEDVEAINILPGASHTGCVQPAITATWNFFNGMANLCGTSSLAQIAESTVDIFPNPAEDKLWIESGRASGNIEIMDLNGSKVLEQQVQSNRTNIDVSSLTNGLYVVRLIDNVGVHTRRVIIAP